MYAILRQIYKRNIIIILLVVYIFYFFFLFHSDSLIFLLPSRHPPVCPYIQLYRTSSKNENIFVFVFHFIMLLFLQLPYMLFIYLCIRNILCLDLVGPNLGLGLFLLTLSQIIFLFPSSYFPFIYIITYSSLLRSFYFRISSSSFASSKYLFIIFQH